MIQAFRSSWGGASPFHLQIAQNTADSIENPATANLSKLESLARSCCGQIDDGQDCRDIAGISFLRVLPFSDASWVRWLGADDSAVYSLYVNEDDYGNVHIQASRLPDGNVGEAQRLFRFRLSKWSDGLRMLKTYDRVPEAVELLNQETRRLTVLNKTIAERAIGESHRCRKPVYMEPVLELSENVRGLIAPLARPKRMQTDDVSWMYWSIWTSPAYGGRFVAWSQFVSAYCCFVDADGVVIDLKDIPHHAVQELAGRYFEPMDEEEEAAFDRIKENNRVQVNEAQRQAAIRRLVQAVGRDQKGSC
jgi:hypothetical protein